MNFESDVMALNFEGNVGYLTFKDFKKYNFINHAYLTRLGGVSKNEFKSLNLSFSCGDDQTSVMKNYDILCNALNLNKDKIVRTKQVHKNKITVVSEKDILDKNFKERVFKGSDGLITNIPGVILTTLHADCMALFMVDPVLKVVGLAHAGWRGTVSKIAKSLLEMFINNYGSNPENIVCALGPGIGMCCFEVDDGTFKEFKKIGISDFEKCYISKENKYYIDSIEVNKKILIESGVKSENIFKSDVCTCCHHDLLFSHRASGGKRGNNLAFITIKE